MGPDACSYPRTEIWNPITTKQALPLREPSYVHRWSQYPLHLHHLVEFDEFNNVSSSIRSLVTCNASGLRSYFRIWRWINTCRNKNILCKVIGTVSLSEPVFLVEQSSQRKTDCSSRLRLSKTCWLFHVTASWLECHRSSSITFAKHTCRFRWSFNFLYACCLLIPFVGD